MKQTAIYGESENLSENPHNPKKKYLSLISSNKTN